MTAAGSVPHPLLPCGSLTPALRQRRDPLLLPVWLLPVVPAPLVLGPWSELSRQLMRKASPLETVHVDKSPLCSARLSELFRCCYLLSEVPTGVFCKLLLLTLRCQEQLIHQSSEARGPTEAEGSLPLELRALLSGIKPLTCSCRKSGPRHVFLLVLLKRRTQAEGQGAVCAQRTGHSPGDSVRGKCGPSP